MLDKWHKKEKPVFTGIARGVGGFAFNTEGAVTSSVDPNMQASGVSYLNIMIVEHYTGHTPLMLLEHFH